jgi:two-component system phosphate regulon response regulator OmpR
MTRILIVEDEPSIATALEDALRLEGYEVNVVSDGLSAERAALREHYDLILLDVMLPQKDGFSVCRALRSAHLATPIIVVTARTQEVDKIVGLELGADDYLPKPFEPRELLARLRAILRRGAARGHARPLRFGRLEIDRDAHAVRLDGVDKPLTGHQFALLVALAENAGRVLSRETLMDLVKGEALDAYDRSIDMHISRIRAAIEDDPKAPRRILTVRGTGYLFARSQDS